MIAQQRWPPSSPQPRKANGEGLRQGVIRIIAKSPHAPIGVRRRFHAARLSAKAAELRDMLVANLLRPQHSREGFAVELRIGPRSRHRPHVDDEIDMGLPKQIDEFDDRSGGVTDREKGARLGPTES